MNSTMAQAIRQLMTTFLVLFLLISAVAAYIALSNQAFFNGPVLAQGKYDPRICPPYDSPVRGTIFDRNGVKLAWSEPNPDAFCGYQRRYDPRVASSGLAPLLGYYSPVYGIAGVESSYNDELAGVMRGETLQDVGDKLLHRPRRGQDITLTIDINLQVQASKNYDQAYLAGTNIGCQAPGSNPPGAMVVENPSNGEILAMVSKPSYDPNKIAAIAQPSDDDYYQTLRKMSQSPLLNRAAQGLYVPGSTFKTMSLIAGLDSGVASLDTPYTKEEALNFLVNGQVIKWDGYYAGEWQSGGHIARFPMPLADGYAYSDNVIFARLAVKTGADTWLDYVRRFGIKTPGTNVDPIPFDAPYSQSQAFNAIKDGKANEFSVNLLAESGFGQGELLISPLTMTEVSSAVANGGVLVGPHVRLGKQTESKQVMSDGTAAALRQAMWDVVDHGTADTYLSPNNSARLANSPIKQGGKTGTGQSDAQNPQSWWISFAGDDQAPGGGPARLAITVFKEHSGDGGCQTWVADATYRYAADRRIGPYGNS